MGCLTFFEDDVAFDTWFDDVDVGEVEAVELIDEVAVERVGVAVVHAVPGAAGCDAGGGAVASPNGDDGFEGFEEEAGAVFDGAAVGVGALVAAVFEELGE